MDLISFTANGMHAIDIGKTGSWDGTSVLTFTTGTQAVITSTDRETDAKQGITETSILSSYAGKPSTPNQGEPYNHSETLDAEPLNPPPVLDGVDKDRTDVAEVAAVEADAEAEPPVLASDKEEATYGEATGTVGHYVYVLAFKIVNPASAQAASKISIDVSDAFEEHVFTPTLYPNNPLLAKGVVCTKQSRMQTEP